mgnify:CR=1 FL=1
MALSNNNAEIRRIKGRIAELTKKQETAYAGWEFDGGKVEANREDNRLQIFFEEKPDEKTRETLKENASVGRPKPGCGKGSLTTTPFTPLTVYPAYAPYPGKAPLRYKRKPVQPPRQRKSPLSERSCTGQRSLEICPQKGNGENEKAGLRKELTHAEI